MISHFFEIFCTFKKSQAINFYTLKSIDNLCRLQVSNAINIGSPKAISKKLYFKIPFSCTRLVDTARFQNVSFSLTFMRTLQLSDFWIHSYVDRPWVSAVENSGRRACSERIEERGEKESGQEGLSHALTPEAFVDAKCFFSHRRFSLRAVARG